MLTMSPSYCRRRRTRPKLISRHRRPMSAPPRSTPTWRVNMPRISKPLRHVLLLLSLVSLISCTSAPRPLPTAIAQCPQFPPPPPHGLDPPQATNATTSLQGAFQKWASSASTTQTPSQSGNSGTVGSGNH